MPESLPQKPPKSPFFLIRTSFVPRRTFLSHFVSRLMRDLFDRVERRHGLVVERAYGAQVSHDAVGGLVVEGDGARPPCASRRPRGSGPVASLPGSWSSPSRRRPGPGPRARRRRSGRSGASAWRHGSSRSPPGARGIPPQSERTFGRFGRGGVPPGHRRKSEPSGRIPRPPCPLRPRRPSWPPWVYRMGYLLPVEF